MQSPNRLDESRLLSLPKELRLEIWTYVLTDSSRDRPVLCIMRKLGGPVTSSHRFSNAISSGKRLSNSSNKNADIPGIKTSFAKRLASPISVSLLQTSHLIYMEALPILYRSITFCPWNLEGIFPLFLDTLSAFAKSQIRYIRLDTSTAAQTPTFSFYWALTCAQIAQLSDSLRQVEVEIQGEWLGSTDRKIYERAILYPLLKIKAPKKLVNGCDTNFQQILTEAATKLAAKSDVRKALTAANSAERRRLDSLPRLISDTPTKKPNSEELPTTSNIEESIPLSLTDQQEITHGLTAIPCIEQFEEEFLEWELVSVACAAPSPILCSTSTTDEGFWVDTASMIIGDKDNGDNWSDDKINDWELVVNSPM